MTEIQYENDVSQSLQRAKGSDGRLNVSSRTDGRSYYISRDAAQAYSVVFDDTDCDVGDEFFYLKNDSVNMDLVLDSIGINATLVGSFKLQFEVGTDIAGASVLTPTNLNKSSSKQAVVTCRGNSLLTGTSIPDGVIDHVALNVAGHEEFRLKDRIRLGQGDAISILYDRGTANNIVEGVVYFYFE